MPDLIAVAAANMIRLHNAQAFARGMIVGLEIILKELDTVSEASEPEEESEE